MYQFIEQSNNMQNMKKTYISPELEVQLMQTEGLLALSLKGEANSSDALVKGSGDWGDIWGDDEELDIDE